ncbi:leupaxin isoform X2 [Lingula anatina]|nr:leupaxin isoform X2 [Lingula anatina]XP_013384969.1 leupaxin isoform X2 [Lingula anatina]|eukprot:XP_013384961.1 leupaxin isoform X2 [Lingula anatina]
MIRHQTTVTQTGQTMTSGGPPPPPKPHPPPPAQGGKSSLSNNLSELDYLLQGLNSAQFMAEVDRRNAEMQGGMGGLHHPPAMGSPTHQQPPSVAYQHQQQQQEGYGGRNTVDSLLDDLQNTVSRGPPAPQQSHQQAYTQQGTYTTVNNPARSIPTNNGETLTDGGPAASSATRELDELMESLSTFKMNTTPRGPPPVPTQQTIQEPPYAKPNKPSKQSVSAAQPTITQQLPQQSRPGGQLDAMLGNLQSDMNRQGVSTSTKGSCAACNKPIVGQVITALGQIWHPEHFMCAHCHQELGTQNFFERDGQPFCEQDYHQLFSPRCAYCNGPILDKCVTALDRTWHPEHFFCAQCGRPFDEDGFHEKDGKAFCREDYFEMFAPKCGGCNRPIMDNYISALNRQWHPECFVCRDCHASFGGGSFFDHEGMPYCETHYHAKRGSLCAGCQKPITGRCITAMYKKFHPEHFVCAFCLKQLNKGTFKEQNEKPYCHACFVKLFG